MDTSTIDQKLRERSDKELKRNISSALNPLCGLKQEFNGRIEVKIDDETTVEYHTLLEAIQKALFDALNARRQQNEIDAFIRSVEDATAAIDELQSR